MPENPEMPAQQPESLTAPLNIPNIPGMPSTMPQSLDWENITNIWQSIEHARQTKEPQEWMAVTSAVADALKTWRKKESKMSDDMRVYQIIKRHAELKPEGEERQAILDKLEKLRETMPLKLRKAAEAGHKAFMPVKVKTIDELSRSLEGIRQGDFESYHPDVKNRIRKFGTEAEEEQDTLRRQIRIQHERLNGIQDPKRRAPLLKRLEDSNKKYQASTDEVEAKQLEREMDALTRRLEGAKTDAGKAKINDTITNLKAKLKTPEELRQAQQKYSDNLKYDALLWLVTVISHPIKARPPHVPGASRGPSQAAQPVGKMPYTPPKPGDIWKVPMPPPSVKKTPRTLLGRAKAEEDPMSQRPYGPQGASECHIFLSMIHEGKFAHAKAFMNSPYVVAEGSLVTLENITDMPELNGLKGRVRAFSEESGKSVIVDLFKNNVIADPAIKVAFYEARPYLL
jgi:hypothetical protein